jgi:hypothetical protein
MSQTFTPREGLTARETAIHARVAALYDELADGSAAGRLFVLSAMLSRAAEALTADVYNGRLTPSIVAAAEPYIVAALNDARILRSELDDLSLLIEPVDANPKLSL